jgi:ABC-type transport system involved in multi-copper enzyme maturation permease subunit
VKAETHLEVYRPFLGKLREHGFRAWPLFTTGLRTALKQKKALTILYLPALVATAIMCFAVWVKFRAEDMLQAERETMDLQEQIATGLMRAQAEELLGVVGLILQFAKFMGGFALLAVSWFASGLFCEDKKAGAHQLYFARPITRLDYFLGKFLVAAYFALKAILVPVLATCIAASIFSPDWSFLRKEWDVFLRALAFSLVWTVVISSLVLAASSLASRKSFALLGIFGFVMLSVPFAGILGQFVDKRLFSLALLIDLDALGQAIFGRPTEIEGVTAANAWGFVTALTLGCWGVVWLRLRRLEVVA